MTVPGGAAHRVVMVTFTLAYGSLTRAHSPHPSIGEGLMKAHGPAGPNTCSSIWERLLIFSPFSPSMLIYWKTKLNL